LIKKYKGSVLAVCW